MILRSQNNHIFTSPLLKSNNEMISYQFSKTFRFLFHLQTISAQNQQGQQHLDLLVLRKKTWPLNTHHRKVGNNGSVNKISQEPLNCFE